MKFISYKRGY
jgi:hypothetical protein